MMYIIHSGNTIIHSLSPSKKITKIEHTSREHVSNCIVPSVAFILALEAFSSKSSRVTVFSQSPRARPIASASRLESTKREGGREGRRDERVII